MKPTIFPLEDSLCVLTTIGTESKKKKKKRGKHFTQEEKNREKEGSNFGCTAARNPGWIKLSKLYPVQLQSTRFDSNTHPFAPTSTDCYKYSGNYKTRSCCL